jgi:replicative DNA helicase
MEITPTAANIDHYIALCREQARTSQLRALGRQMAEEEDPQKLRQLLEEANGRTADRPRLRITGVGDALKSFMDRHTRDVRYLTWPVRELNDRIYAELGDLIIIGGYPSSGKSAWALQCAWHWAREYRVGFFSLETSSEKLFDRLMSSVAELSMDNIKRNTIDQAGWDKVCSMTEDITARQLELIPAAGMSPADVRAVTMMQRYQIIFIDYLQLLQGSGENRTAQVTQISIALHNLAQSLGVTVVALSQLARQGKQEKNSAPDMSALRESGQIEQDADLIMMLSLANKDQPEGNRELRIRKNKEGTCPNILLAFDGKHQTFRKAQPEKSDMLRQMARKKVVPTPVLASEKVEQMTVLPNDFPVPF